MSSSFGLDGSVVGACLHAIPGPDRVQARSYSGQARGFLGHAALALVIAFAPTLRAQEAAPETQDKAPAAVVAPDTQSGTGARSGPTGTHTSGSPDTEAVVALEAPIPAPAPVTPAAPPVVLEAPAPSPAPAAPAPAAPQWIDRGEVVVFGNDVVLRENERAWKVVALGGDVEVRGCVTGEVVAIGGDVKIAGSAEKAVAVGGDVEVTGRLGGELVAVFGDVKLDGPVGKLVAVLGDVTLGPKASVAGEVVAVGGDFHNPDHAPIRGQTVALGGFLPHLTPLLDWVGHGLFHARLLTPGLAWPWYVFGGCTLFSLLLAALFGRGVNACARVLEENPGTTLGTAIVLLLLLPLFVLLLICTVIGIALLPFLAVAVLFAFAFGKVAVLAFLGRSLLRAFGGGAEAERAWLTVLIGAVLLAVLYCIPWLGLLVWALTAWIGLGMVVAAIRQNRRQEKARIAALRPPVNPAVFPAAVTPAAAGGFVTPGAVPADPSAMDTGAGVAGSDPAAAASVPPVIQPLPHVAMALEAATLPRADFWLRLGAILVDIVLVAVGTGVTVVLSFLPFPLVFGGYVFAFWQWKGTTIGGIVFNLKVVRLDGRPVDAATALVRTLVAFLSVFAAGLGFLWCLWDPECQTWHDKVAGTVVVRVPKSLPLV